VIWCYFVPLIQVFLGRYQGGRAMEAMEQSVQKLKSPLRKLLRVFDRSRNGWKGKYRAVKYECRLMGNQLRAVEKSREKWRQKAQQTQQQLRQLQQELEEYKKSAAA
jgi:uncharacterized protein YukE